MKTRAELVVEIKGALRRYSRAVLHVANEVQAEDEGDLAGYIRAAEQRLENEEDALAELLATALKGDST